jgi:uncharacterized protein (TIGR03118 family)
MSLRSFAVATALVSGFALVAPATADAHSPSHHLAVQQVNLVSDQPGKAVLTDPDLVNPWGMSLGATTPLWVSNQATSTSTLYSSAPGSGTVTKVPTVRVQVPLPTGQVANAGSSFVVSNATASAPARFIFATLTGQIAAWNPTINPVMGPADIKATTAGAVYTGLAIAAQPDRLFAADFARGRIDVFDGSFQPVQLSRWAFRDRSLPKGYAPYNVQALDGRIFVTYAKPDPKTGRAMRGHSLGFVDEFTVDGRFVTRVASRGNLNAPWALALAPEAWGQPAGTLLVGNFGDGRINIFRPKSHHGYKPAGQVRTTTGKTLAIDGLWALIPGTATTGGTDVLWFSAGPDDETHGLVGQLSKP